MPDASALATGKTQAVVALLQQAVRDYSPVAFASSFGAEDMVLTDLIVRTAPQISIFTLDTGRLPEETHSLIDRVRAHYGIAIDIYFPDTQASEHYVRANGNNAFFASVELRRACCGMRKTAPLARALADKNAWITGLRRAQAVTRADIALAELDAAHGLAKFNPLVDWSESDVWDYLRSNNVPYNALHDQGYRSIGCAPCTRAIGPEDDVRAGRWWWESPEHKECGLHPRSPAAVPAHVPAHVSVSNSIQFPIPVKTFA